MPAMTVFLAVIPLRLHFFEFRLPELIGSRCTNLKKPPFRVYRRYDVCNAEIYRLVLPIIGVRFLMPLIDDRNIVISILRPEEIHLLHLFKDELFWNIEDQRDSIILMREANPALFDLESALIIAHGGEIAFSFESRGFCPDIFLSEGIK